MTQKSNKILWTIRQICEYCDISQAFFYRLIRTGKFPATIIEGKWCAHTDNIDKFFQIGTKIPPKDYNIEAK